MIQKMADYLGVTPKVLIICLIGFAIAFVIIYIKITIDEKKGVNSQEKADIRKLISHTVPDGTQYMAAYAYSKEVYRSRSFKREVYHYYAIGFRPTQTDHMWVIPITMENGKMVYADPIRLSAETLAYVGGYPGRLEMHFPRTKDVCIISVAASNTKLGKECQVNIQQPEEAEAFQSFGKDFQERINLTLGVDKKGRRISY